MDKDNNTPPKKKEPYRGFASLPREMVQEFGRRGGLARKEQIGTAGFVAIGRQGGDARAAKRREEEEATAVKHVLEDSFVANGRQGGTAKRREEATPASNDVKEEPKDDKAEK